PSFSATPTIGTSVTTPKVSGGIATGSDLTLEGTTSGSPSAAHVLMIPNGGGGVGIAVTPASRLHVKQSANSITGGIQVERSDTTAKGYVYLDGSGRLNLITDAAGSEFSIGSGLTIGAPTGGDQGAGTLNAVGVYDDGVLLTDHIFDAAVDGPRPVESYPERLQAWVAQFDPAWLDPDAYEAHWRTHRRLPLMPERLEARPSLGGMCNTLVLHLEVLAVQLSQARADGRALMARVAALEARR
ncbi:MAG: hypothetical protein Q8S13_09305, partial [Dehalococcoidia bacterium]|nr:hypothetical protein [Dehalococcoidia bacterium]